MQHATVVFRIKWVWIWLRLPGVRVPSGGAFFGRIEYPRFQKKKMENPGLVFDNSRPGDISFDRNRVTVAVDAYALDTAAASNIGTDVDKLLDAEQLLMENRYGALCTDKDFFFFTYGMTSMGRLSASTEHFLRWLANCLPDTKCSRDMFHQY